MGNTVYGIKEKCIDYCSKIAKDKKKIKECITKCEKEMLELY